MKSTTCSELKAAALGAALMLVTSLAQSADSPAAEETSRGKEMLAKGIATPIDLIPYYTTPLARFDHITGYPAFQTVPRGFQVFKNVPLQIEGMICLWGGGNAEKLHIIFPEQIANIDVKQKFETLYVYHASFFSSPFGTPVCEVVMRYRDGTSATNQMFYGDDVLDWVTDGSTNVIGPNGTNSTLAWVGGTFSTNRPNPLRFCLTSLANPKPGVEVGTIDLYSCRSRTAPCIMAITAGRSGLVK